MLSRASLRCGFREERFAHFPPPPQNPQKVDQVPRQSGEATVKARTFVVDYLLMDSGLSLGNPQNVLACMEIWEVHLFFGRLNFSKRIPVLRCHERGSIGPFHTLQTGLGTPRGENGISIAKVNQKINFKCTDSLPPSLKLILGTPLALNNHVIDP